MGKLLESIEGLELLNPNLTSKALKKIGDIDLKISLTEDEEICSVYAIKLIGAKICVLTNQRWHIFIKERYNTYSIEGSNIKQQSGPGVTVTLDNGAVHAFFEAYHVKDNTFFQDSAPSANPHVETIQKILKENNLEAGFRINDHVEAVAKNLKEDAKILFAFTGLIAKFNKNTGACVVTDDGNISIASSGLLTGNDIMKFKFTEIRDFTVTNNVITNNVTIETLTETCEINLGNSEKATKVYQKLIELKEEIDKKQNATTAPNSSAADEILKYKNLLDMAVITQEEFDAKKKQLLGL